MEPKKERNVEETSSNSSPANYIQIKKARNKLTIRTKEDKPEAIVEVPRKEKQIIEVERGVPNIQINYHTYITNYYPAPKFPDANPAVYIENNSMKELPSGSVSVRNAQSGLKPKSSFVDKLYNQISSPRSTVTAATKMSGSVIAIPAEQKGKRQYTIKLGKDNGVKQVTVIQEGIANMSPELRAKLAKNIKRSFMSTKDVQSQSHVSTVANHRKNY